MDFIRLLLLLLPACRGTSGTSQRFCNTPQFLELGKTGTINCSLPRNFHTISWYNSTDYDSGYPVIYITNSVKDGLGYVTGEYDINSDGSLRINKVLLEHDRYFTLLFLYEETRIQVVNKVRVVVTVKPEQQFPYVYNCGHKKRICLQQEKENYFNCSVIDALPVVSLKWITRTADGDKSIPFETFQFAGKVGFTSKIATKLPSNSTFLSHLLVCKADSDPPLLAQNESFVLVDPKNVNLSASVPIEINVRRHTRLELLCTTKTVIFFIWKRRQGDDELFTNLCFGVFTEEKYTESFSDQFGIAGGGSLILPSVRVKDEGLYVCISSDGLTNQAVVYKVTVHGTDQITEEHFHPTKQISYPDASIQLWIISVVVSVLLIVTFGRLLLKCLYSGKRRASKRTTKIEHTNADEEVPMMTSFNNEDLNDLKKQFMKELTEKYKDLYNGVQPIPYMKNKLFGVDKVFVDVNIELLVCPDEGGDQTVWQNIGSYRNIFNDPRAKSTRRIIEGEPGYGKTILTLQLACDWCNRHANSTLDDFEVLILLQLWKICSGIPIYRAIKELLLPRDSRITEEHIEKILSASKRVLVLLDGFNEYSDQSDDARSDISDILGRKMFQAFDVILTTRSLVLPKQASPLTRRLRLGGFDEKAQLLYTQKAVVPQGDDGSDKIVQCTTDNPVLSDLCQVPLFFVIFAHIMHNNYQFQNLSSVTTLFRFLISCLNGHIEKKMESEDSFKNTNREGCHHNFNKFAFEYLRRGTRGLKWSREDVSQLLGSDVYDWFVRTGILIEEEQVDIIHEKGSNISGSIQRFIKVRFFHGILCEWYAAHYLVDCLQKHPSLDLSEFLQLHDPVDLQYLYRFACGISSFAAGKIINYVHKLEGGDKFSILCIFEKPGDDKDMKEQIRQLCRKKLVVSGYDSLLLQRSILQLLELAAKNDIPIDSLSLHNCLKTVNIPQSSITIQSGLIFSARIPLKKLVITLSDRTIEEKETTDILEFSTLCQNLESIGFYGCVPSRVVVLGSIASSLLSKNVEVWCRTLRNSPIYLLDLNSGKWKSKETGLEVTEEQWRNMRLQREHRIKTKTREDYKKSVKEGREKHKREALTEELSG